MRKRVVSTVSWEKYLVDDGSNPRIKRFLESRGSDIFNQLAQNIHKAYNRKKKHIIFIVHPHINNAVIIKDTEYLRFLKVALDWFEKKENYKECAKIKSWIDNQTSTEKSKRTDKVKKNIFI